MKYFEKNYQLYSDYMEYCENIIHYEVLKKMSTIFGLHEVFKKQLSTIFEFMKYF